MTYDQWFRSQQGIPYEGAYLFAEAAWEHRQNRIHELETQLEKNNPLLDEAADKIDALEKQRDELLAAIEEICWLRPLGFRETKYSLAVEKAATKAIASVKGQQ